MLPRRGAFARLAKVTLCTFAVFFSAYHATSSHVKQNHELYGTTDQSKQLLIVRRGEHGVVLQKHMMLLLVTSRYAVRSILLQT